MSKKIIIVFVVLLVVGVAVFYMTKKNQIGNVDRVQRPEPEQTYDLEDNEKRNAEFLAMMREGKHLERKKVDQIETFSKSGFFQPEKKCSIYKASKVESKIIAEVPKGRKVWVEVVNANWGKVSTRTKLGFISNNCL